LLYCSAAGAVAMKKNLRVPWFVEIEPTQLSGTVESTIKFIPESSPDVPETLNKKPDRNYFFRAPLDGAPLNSSYSQIPINLK
jgi:hypothetical protein